jgi:hypothetical protein
MNLTIEEIKERIKRWDELSIIDELNIKSHDLVERFEDLIEDNADRLQQLVEWEDE